MYFWRWGLTRTGRVPSLQGAPNLGYNDAGSPSGLQGNITPPPQVGGRTIRGAVHGAAPSRFVIAFDPAAGVWRQRALLVGRRGDQLSAARWVGRGRAARDRHRR